MPEAYIIGRVDERRPAIAFEAVSFAYPGRPPILDTLSFGVPAGTSVALLGASGAGKSTILRLINGLLAPSSGRVSVEQRETREWDPYALRRRIGYVLQEVGLFPHQTVEQNVTLVPRLVGWTPERCRARARELLALVGLPAEEMARRWPDELSGGQRQRVGVARALAADPPILLLDEPFGALDAITRRDLQREFLRIQRRLKKTVVLVTHDVDEARLLGDRVGVIDAGVLVAWDHPDRVARSDDPRVRPFFTAGGRS